MMFAFDGDQQKALEKASKMMASELAELQYEIARYDEKMITHEKSDTLVNVFKTRQADMKKQHDELYTHYTEIMHMRGIAVPALKEDQPKEVDIPRQKFIYDNGYGKTSDMYMLPVGTKFSVMNGGWDGEIIREDGKKYILMDNGYRKVELTPETDYGLVIEIETVEEN